MLKVIQRFAKHCSCHLQVQYVLVGHFWKPYIGQAAIQLVMSNVVEEKWR
jgi:hypothetical protein